MALNFFRHGAEDSVPYWSQLDIKARCEGFNLVKSGP